MLEAVAKMFRSRPSTKMEAFVRQVADESVDDIAQLVANHMEGMTLSEARGYVRARSAQIVRRRTRLAINRNPNAAPDWNALIVRRATERLVPFVLRQTSFGIPRRAAA